MADKFVDLPDSHRPQKSSAHRLGDLAPDTPLALTVFVARAGPAQRR